ncbi:MAG: hypothetical protein CEN89_735 [Candidatus Berkelbacteria bacterium Licking1014_7]|uniref:Uncharacterized protein n=1 Tax=Candidatus Berkelbacteria bacterium Licking1014_7 TaxID=2017147 RepID=A0A554LHQ1_9BACT|nr:MAG: hypothetical protein CEN89_735 [Candidatus Berkelbacteria bacterium Licking1014_7]
MEESTNKSGMSTGMVIGIAVIVAIVFGGGAYAYVNNKATKEKDDLNAQITELQSQVSSAAIATTTPSSTTSATADATANWKTYTNSTYGFSFKYPSDWTATESTTYPGALISVGVDTPSRKVTNKCHEDGCDSPNSMSVHYYDSIMNKDSEGGYSSLLNYLKVNSGNDEKRYSSYTAAKVGTENGYKAIAGKNTFGGGTYYFVEKSDKKVLEVWMFDGDKEVTPTIDSQILASFQFTK